MTTSTFDEMTNENAFLEILKRIHAACVAPWHRVLLSKNVVQLFWSIAQIKTASDAAIRELRAKLSTCQASCEVRNSCFESTLDDAKKVRACIINLQDTMGVKPYFAVYNKMVDDVATDWDDLVEDLTVSGDPEFRELASKLSFLVNGARQ